MGWAYCGLDAYGREIGYGIGATCDRRGCDAEIDRGLGYCCGPMHGGGEGGCGRYYCGEHLWFVGPRGGCHHRGKKAWGKTRCQLLRRDVWMEPPSTYYCACHEFEYSGPDLPQWDPKKGPDPVLFEYWRVPGYEPHLIKHGLASDMTGERGLDREGGEV